MNRIQFYKIISVILLYVGGSEFIPAELLRPNIGGEEKEILVINSKRRLYYTVEEKGLTYTVFGPRRLELISRLPVKNKRKKSHPFTYIIILDESDSVVVQHKYFPDKRIRSVQHPNHYVTYSGNYFINLSAGKHSIRVIPGMDQKIPVLIRVIGKEFSSDSDTKINLVPTAHQSAQHLITGSREIEYYELNSRIPLQVTANGPGLLKITSRLEFETWMGSEEVYRLKVTKGKKVIGTYYFTSERSTDATIKELPDRVPAKWRTCEIEVPKGQQTYNISLLEKDRTVLLRFTEYK